MAQTLPNGTVVPNEDGREQISETGVQEMRTLGASVDTALGQKANHDYVDAGDQAVIDELMPRAFYRGPIPLNTNVDNMVGLEWAGMWTISNALFANSLTGLPEAVPDNRRLGQFLVMSVGNRITSHLYTPYGFQNTTELWYRTTAWAGSPSRPFEWNEWTNLAGGNSGQSGTSVGLANQILREQMARRRGDTIGVGDKGVVAFRFDHGLNNFRSLVVPLLRKWNLPSSQAYLSEMFDGTTSAPDESTDSSWAEVREWALTAGVEPMAHSATHFDAGTPARLRAEIVGCFEDLSAAIPEAAIESWAVPGGGGTEYMGFNDGRLPEHFYGTEAGKLLLSTYAFSMGHIGGGEWLLNGSAPQGSRHSTVDTSQAINAARSNVRRAAENRTGYVVMLHPRFLTEGGDYTTEQELDEFLGYLAGMRDEGRIEVMTIGGLVHARTGDNRRLNLINGGTFQTGWDEHFRDTEDWERRTENGVSYIRTSSGSTVKQDILRRKVEPHRGAVYEIIATVRSTTGGTARIGTPTIDDAFTDVEIGSAWQDIRQYVTIPLNYEGNFDVWAGRVSGTVDVMNLRLQPV